MKKNLLWVLLASPVFLTLQDKGIVFEHQLSWQEVLQKAKTQHKYIFVDCYASWCGPCKLMDKEVYPNDTVGKLMNDQFISVKVQIDSTRNDSKELQEWYGTAHELKVNYAIHAFPSYLFFSPDGEIVHKEIGARNVNEFMAVADRARDPHEQFYTLLRRYEQGRLGYAEMPYLAKTAKQLMEDSLGMQVATAYLHGYLETLTPDRLWTKENLSFIAAWKAVLHPRDKLFQLYLRDKKQIDSVKGIPGYADGLINYMVYSGEIKPASDAALENHTEPDWQGLEKYIGEHYGGQYVEDNVMKGRVEFYKAAKRWHEYAKYLVMRGEYWKIGTPGGAGGFILLNNYAYEVFKYSDEKEELETALVWVDRALAMDSAHPSPQALDTKANILYKLGKKSEGLALEEQSVSLAPNDKDIQENFTKMKTGQATWPLD